MTACARRCAHCEAPMRYAPAWHRLCWKCYRMVRVGDQIRRAASLLREIAARDGAP